MSLIVQKFGGTSLRDISRIRHVAKLIAAAREDQNHIVVVVSAMGRTTDELCYLADQFNTLPNPRERSSLLVTGEMQSAALLVMALNELDLGAATLSAAQLDMRAVGRYDEAKLCSLNKERIEQYLAKQIIPVICGFQALNQDDEWVTLGRGGSDTSAVFIASQIKADRCDIYTDVPGVMSANPKQIDNAFLLPKLPLAVMHQFAKHGAQVLHPPSIELALNAKIPIQVLSSYEQGQGTTLTSTNDKEQMIYGVTLNHDFCAVEVDKEEWRSSEFDVIKTDDGAIFLVGPGNKIMWLLADKKQEIEKQRIATNLKLAKLSIIGSNLTAKSDIYKCLLRHAANGLVHIHSGSMVISAYICQERSVEIFKEVHFKVLQASRLSKMPSFL